MELSCKITRSTYLYLESLGEVAGDCFEACDLSPEVALDAERWLPANQVESFLEKAQETFLQHHNAYPKNIALKAPELKGWGLLDQVLRIIQSPSEIYQQPEKFLSYFLRPEIPVDWIAKNDCVATFRVPVSSEELPLVTDYLVGALEVIAVFSGEEAAQASWNMNSVSVDWSKKQESIFEDSPPMNIRPQLYKEVVDIVERQQNQIDELREELASKGVEPSVCRSEPTEFVDGLKKLDDYFLRARQLVSLLRAQNGEQKWFKDALKRLNWNELQGLHQKTVSELEEGLKHRDSPKKSDTKQNLIFNL